MLSFQPPKLQDQLIKAVICWTTKFELDPPETPNFLYDMAESDAFDASTYEDQIVEPNSTLKVGLFRWDEIAVITCEEFINLVEELQVAKLNENKTCLSNKRLLVRVEPSNEAASQFLHHAIPSAENEKEEETRKNIVEAREKILHLSQKTDNLELSDSLRGKLIQEWNLEREKEAELFDSLEKSTQRFCLQSIILEGAEVHCSLTKGFTIFGILISSIGEYDKYFPPILDADLFIEIRFNQRVSELKIWEIFESYLFELNSSLNISVSVSPRPYLETSWLDERCDNYIPDPRFRPLLLGKGLSELLKLYNRATASNDPDVQILYFTKVVEYVSQTVVRIQSHEAIRAKLLSPRALQPDAEYISELENLVETQRNFKKDREAIRQTILICCEVSELAKLAPSFLLKDFKHISSESNQQDKAKALEALAKSLYSTRNEIAHAKANYAPTGEECPQDQLVSFSQCIQVASQQVIRWYYFTPESIRLT
ncbi:MAG: hypothetical protein KME15_01190 [Drouetiella hepatica Uher 2000/2452]|jgi:hypothetical protein|uniref:Uncharacterized protein n=1 Tax=Drouetiella hepatica Uher 2000/2452 TaxID=904376 RepID=A0A951ULU8_9CYAN|nr:hypothetical protein [Drouetiella hepatica Uher 2000/2452]